MKQEILSNDGINTPALVAISIAEESFELWHDVLTNENHPFHRLNEGISLQFDFCFDLSILVRADIDGGIKMETISVSFLVLFPCLQKSFSLDALKAQMLQ